MIFIQSEFYKRYMRSETWQQRKQERLEIDGRCCVMCGRPEGRCRNGLQVHHITYKNLGHEDVMNDICTVCGSCHKNCYTVFTIESEGLND